MKSKNEFGQTIGTTLNDKYLIKKLVGQGGMGAVYEAVHLGLQTSFAIKTLRAKYLGNRQALERFRQEAQTAASIGHDNICEVIDMNTAEGGTAYYVMPLLSGASLGEILQEQTLDLPTIADILHQTLSALGAAHEVGVVHRDLKPDNIFITSVGDRQNFVKLLDFGISKILNQKAPDKLTRTGAVMGTPYYMSPEQAMGASDIDHRVDIYAAGVILYRMLTGKYPFDGDSYNQVLHRIAVESFPAPSTLATVPVSVEKVIVKAMARDVVKRYHSAEQMQCALREAVCETTNGAPVPVTATETSMGNSGPFTPNSNSHFSTDPDEPPSFSERERNRVLPKRKSAIWVLAIGLILVAAGSVTWIYWSPEPPARDGSPVNEREAVVDVGQDVVVGRGKPLMEMNDSDANRISRPAGAHAASQPSVDVSGSDAERVSPQKNPDKTRQAGEPAGEPGASSAAPKLEKRKNQTGPRGRFRDGSRRKKIPGVHAPDGQKADTTIKGRFETKFVSEY